MIIKLILCHLIGDYVLQSRYVAESKGQNWYHLIVHCILYCAPLFVCFGISWQLAVVFIVHLVVDALKARYHKIGYADDQITHYAVLVMYLI